MAWASRSASSRASASWAWSSWLDSIRSMVSWVFSRDPFPGLLLLLARLLQVPGGLLGWPAGFPVPWPAGSSPRTGSGRPPRSGQVRQFPLRSAPARRWWPPAWSPGPGPGPPAVPPGRRPWGCRRALGTGGDGDRQRLQGPGEAEQGGHRNRAERARRGRLGLGTASTSSSLRRLSSHSSPRSPPPRSPRGLSGSTAFRGTIGVRADTRRVGADGLVQVEVGLALEALVPGVFLLGGLGADERHLEVRQDRAAADGGAQGVALVLGGLHAEQDGRVAAGFQLGEGPLRAVPEIHFERGFQGCLVILEESPIAVHDEETVAHGQSLQCAFTITQFQDAPWGQVRRGLSGAGWPGWPGRRSGGPAPGSGGASSRRPS